MAQGKPINGQSSVISHQSSVISHHSSVIISHQSDGQEGRQALIFLLPFYISGCMFTEKKAPITAISTASLL
jgi:hypothetical protein